MDISVVRFNEKTNFETRSVITVKELIRDFSSYKSYDLSMDFDNYNYAFASFECEDPGKTFYSIVIEGTKPEVITLVKKLLSKINTSV